MDPTWALLGVLAMSVLEFPGVFGYVPEPLSTYRPKKSFPVRRDESAIYFPDAETVDVDDSRQHTGSKRSLSDSDHVPARFSDLYPQTSFFNAERPARADVEAHGPQNGWGNPPAPWGNPGFNNNPRQNRPNWGGGQNQPWGNGGGNFNRPGNTDYDEAAFVFDRPPPNGGGRPQPGNGGFGRPQPGQQRPGNNDGVARPPPGTGGVARPPPGTGGVARPQPGQQRPGNNGNGGRPRPTTTPATTTTRRPAAATTTRRPVPGDTPTAPTPAPTRPGCNCPSTPEFNPVCGQDRVTYTNPGKLRCANVCGNNVMMLHFGACVTTTTPPPSR